jgi:hypothetical protein
MGEPRWRANLAPQRVYRAVEAAGLWERDRITGETALGSGSELLPAIPKQPDDESDWRDDQQKCDHPRL